MSAGRAGRPTATNSLRAFVRAVGLRFASAETNSGIPIFTFSGATFLRSLIAGASLSTFKRNQGPLIRQIQKRPTVLKNKVRYFK